MRSIRFLLLAALAVLAGALTLVAGCFNYQSDCTYTLECVSTTTGGDGGPGPGCDPTQTKDPVGDACGIFVSPKGDDKNTGSKLLPLKTLAAAVGKGGTIYVCAGTTPYTEAVTISKPVTLFGGVDCTTWAASPGHKSQLTAAAGAVPLSLEAKATGSVIHDFAVTAADATAAGGSSIAIVDDSASATLDGVDVSAGKGSPGTAGAAPPAQVVTPGTAKGGDGNPDTSCNMAGPIVGGGGGTNACGGIDTSGGDGGNGKNSLTGGTGSDGLPAMSMNGGTGQTTLSCNPGNKGVDGAPGLPGMGARGVGDVNVSGYQGPTATTGGNGSPGQGGGGGGGGKQCNPGFAGASGGGGGAGGCPGSPGVIATSGGSSIGILALNATLTMTGVTVTTHVGGDGGVGGDGQAGGNGGVPGNAGAAGACPGGPGGQGGVGGGGGGGAGGHSLGIAVKGGKVPDLKGATVSHGMGGTGGNGGNMDAGIVARGSDGLACKTFDFGNPMSPTACAM